MRRLLALACLVVVLGGGAASARAGTDLRSDTVRPQPVALVWGNGVFFTRAGISRWLLAHHGAYAAWAPLHPAALEILRTSAGLPIRFLPSQHASTTSPPPALPPLSTGGTSSASGVVMAVLVAAAALLLAAALPPARLLAHRFPLLAILPQRRLITAVAALAIAVGIAAAKLVR